MSPSDGPRLTVKQVAERLGIKRTLAYRLIHTGAIPAYRFGGAIRVRLADLERYEARAAIVADRPPDDPPPVPARTSRRGVVEEEMFKYIKPGGRK